MDASQYKDYVLVLLFVKYISDRYAGQPYAAITIPPGASFADMVALKGKPDIGDQINKNILGPLARDNKLADMPDFNDPAKLGSGKEMVERLTNLVAIFENPALDFSKNRADGDDLLGDAYEYLMRHFATESGKSKGQFYTPAEVSRVIAQLLGVRGASATAQTTVYDPTCGSGSLLLKVAEEAAHGRDVRVTLYGQEKGQRHGRLGAHEHDPARLRHGRDQAGQHAGEPPVFEGRGARHLRLRRLQSAVLRQEAGTPAWTRSTTCTTGSPPTACRRRNRATTPTCCTSCALSGPRAKARASSRTACSSAAVRKAPSGATLSSVATSRASSACRPTCSSARAYPPASWCSTRRAPRRARASS